MDELSDIHMDDLADKENVEQKEMEEHKVSARYKAKHEERLGQEIESVEDMVTTLIVCCGASYALDKEIGLTLRERGIKSRKEWQDYIDTMKRDGSILSELCEELNVDTSQIVPSVKGLKKSAAGVKAMIEDEENTGGISQGSTYSKEDKNVARLQRQIMVEAPIGVPSERSWNNYATASAREAHNAGRSLENAQILLKNLCHWPEHVQLNGALHRASPGKAYDEVKQLALSIEQSKAMFGKDVQTV
ncbi:hypothetical protein OSTOST_08137 [Ostertagia ostertagi]